MIYSAFQPSRSWPDLPALSRNQNRLKNPFRSGFPLFTESQRSLEKDFYTTDSTRTSWRNMQSKLRSNFDYAKWNLWSKLPRSLSQQTMHDPTFSPTRWNSACIPGPTPLARVCCWHTPGIPTALHRDAAHNWRCSRNSSTLLAGSLHTLNKVVKMDHYMESFVHTRGLVHR